MQTYLHHFPSRYVNHPVWAHLAVEQFMLGSFPGNHEAIVPRDLREQVQTLLRTNGEDRRNGQQATDPSLLAGLLYDDRANRLTHQDKEHATATTFPRRTSSIDTLMREVREVSRPTISRNSSCGGWSPSGSRVQPYWKHSQTLEMMLRCSCI